MNKNKENKDFFDWMSNYYDSSIIQFWMKSFYKPVVSEVSLADGERLLDVGCGTGNLLNELSSKYEGSFYGVDLSEKMIEEAKNKLSSDNLKVGDVHSLPFKDNYFDYVISTEAFHHYRNQEKALWEMKRVAKNSGEVIVSDLEYYFNFLHRIHERLEPGCFKVNSKNELKRLFSKVGLKIEKQERNSLIALLTKGVKKQ